MIILDFETNSSNEHDVIEVAALKVELKNGKYILKDKFHRYYLSRYLVEFKNHFCTMKENKKIVKALNKNGKIKNPKLLEVCEYYGIKFDRSSHHSAIYDVTKTYEILICMNESKL